MIVGIRMSGMMASRKHLGSLVRTVNATFNASDIVDCRETIFYLFVIDYRVYSSVAFIEPAGLGSFFCLEPGAAISDLRGQPLALSRPSVTHCHCC